MKLKNLIDDKLNGMLNLREASRESNTLAL